MKIGILTHPLETNYGGLLQAYALQHVLRKLGHDAITIDRHNSRKYNNYFHHLLGFLKRCYTHYLKGENCTTAWDPFLSDEEVSIISAKMRSFVDKNICTTRRIFSSELSLIEDEYMFDAYVVGSDQVWLPNYCPNSFLDFVSRNDVIRITYAASCGKVSFANNPKLANECSELAKKFKAISVREEVLLDLCRDCLSVDAVHVLDPTLLLHKEDYLALIDNQDNKEDLIFAYILDHSPCKTELIYKTSLLTGKPVKYGNVEHYYTKGSEFRLEDCIFPSVEDWLYGLSRAEFVITDSFHGTALSLVFNKQFAVTANNKRGIDRFKSLFTQLGITDRFVASTADMESLLKTPIDYTTVNQKLNILRKDSISFLTNNLK